MRLKFIWSKKFKLAISKPRKKFQELKQVKVCFLCEASELIKLSCTSDEPSTKICLTIDIKFTDPIHLLIQKDRNCYF